MPSIKSLKADKRVEFIDDERGIGNGVLVTLKKGWTFEPGVDNRVRGEDTIAEMALALKQVATRFAGPYDA